MKSISYLYPLLIFLCACASEVDDSAQRLNANTLLEQQKNDENSAAEHYEVQEAAAKLHKD